MTVTPRDQVWNIISGLTADGNATSRAPLTLWKGDEQALHALSMLSADVLATFRAAGIEPTDLARTSVLYRLIAYLAKRPRIRLTRALWADVQLIASYLPGRFVEASLEGWRALLAPPTCGGDCRIPIPPHGGPG